MRCGALGFGLALPQPPSMICDSMDLDGNLAAASV